MLPGTVVVKNRTRIAKPGSVMHVGCGQILHHADESPCQYQTQTDQQQRSDRDIHAAILKFVPFSGCRNNSDNNVRAAV